MTAARCLEPVSHQPDAPNARPEQMIDIARIEGQVRASSVKKISELVANHPEEAIAIMRTWIYQGS